LFGDKSWTTLAFYTAPLPMQSKGKTSQNSKVHMTLRAISVTWLFYSHVLEVKCLFVTSFIC